MYVGSLSSESARDRLDGDGSRLRVYDKLLSHVDISPKLGER